MHRRDSAVRWCTGMVVAAVALVAFAGSAFAQALGPPTSHVNRTRFFRIDLDVTAGASGAPNGFVIQWMKKADFQLYGWPADEYGPYSNSCDFTGVPTLNTDSRSPSYDLASDGVIQVQM